MCVLISCETGGNEVPGALVGPHDRDALLERSDAPTMASSKGKKRFPRQLPPTLSGDRAAAYAAERLSRGLDAPLIINEYSPELIDVGRSLHHRELFPKPIRHWPAEDRQILLDEIHRPYRERVRRAIAGGLLRYSHVVHLSIRSFDQRSKGKYRRADVGLLYDPSNDDELDFCLDWIDELYEDAEMLRVRRNYPRRGTSDSITKSMRTEFAGTRYIGIEVLLNRAWVARSVSLRDEAIDGIIGSLRALTDSIQVEAA